MIKSNSVLNYFLHNDTKDFYLWGAVVVFYVSIWRVDSVGGKEGRDEETMGRGNEGTRREEHETRDEERGK